MHLTLIQPCHQRLWVRKAKNQIDDTWDYIIQNPETFLVLCFSYFHISYKMCSTYICKWVYIWYKRRIHEIPFHFQKDERREKMLIHKSVKVFKQWGACHEVPENYDCVKISRPRNFFLLFAPMILYDSMLSSCCCKYRNQPHTSNDTHTVQIYLIQLVTLWIPVTKLHCSKWMYVYTSQYSSNTIS